MTDAKYIFCRPHSKTKNLNDRSFGRLRVIGYIGTNRTRNAVWLCLCNCGTWKIITGHELLLGTQSCGCLRLERARESTSTHRASKSPEYRAYYAAKSRCTNPNVHNFHRWGGRGIEFRFNSFEEFFADIGQRPSKAHSLDRRNNNGHYEKGNIHWATRIEQANNTAQSKNHSVLARDLSLTPGAITHRIKQGWCNHCVFTLPKYSKCPHY